MPIYEYRCECGEVIEALVRGGREPATGDEAGHFCETGGKLVKLISAHHVGSRGGGGAFRDAGGGADAGTCGSCGRVPGSCASD